MWRRLPTCRGLPWIYAGEEQAFRGIKEHRAGGDDAIRPAFPETAADLAPFGWATYRLHQELIGLRRHNPWLHRARTRVTALRNADFTFEAFHEANRLWVALNLAWRCLRADLARPAITTTLRSCRFRRASCAARPAAAAAYEPPPGQSGNSSDTAGRCPKGC